mmetsp:Transcript_13188/g.35888  ORF Transcript_13188/g.35888 Transcript_13188/m.35888 type:complete len:218 (+) Transcript_13188:287-940(+)
MLSLRGHDSRAMQFNSRPWWRWLKFFFLFQVLIIHLVELVRQGDVIYVPAVPIARHLRVNVEENGHVNSLVRLQPLLLKAEALDLVEVLAELVWGDIIHGVPRHRFIAFIVGSEEGQCALPCLHTHVLLCRLELPGHVICNVRVEPYSDVPVCSRLLKICVRILHPALQFFLHSISACYCPPIPSCRTEELVERDRGISKTNHGYRRSSPVHAQLCC